MQFTDAFAALGYHLPAPRTDWTAEKKDGICISLWGKMIRYENKVPRYDSRDRSRDESVWMQKPGHKKRMKHLAAALADYDGLVDVVLLNGTPGETYGDAHPWLPAERKGYKWRVIDFDNVSGHFRVEAQLLDDQKQL